MLRSLFSAALPIGDTLVSLGFINTSQLRKALRIQKLLKLKGFNTPIGKILLKKKYITRQQLYKAYAHQLNLNYMAEISASEELIRSKNINFWSSSNIIPIKNEENFVHIATANPFRLINIAKISLLFSKPVKISLTDKEIIKKIIANANIETSKSLDVWTQNHLSTPTEHQALGGIHERENICETEPLSYLDEIIYNTSDEKYIEKLVSWLLLKAIHAGASDIHFEPNEGSLRIRHRIDGKLIDFDQLAIRNDTAAAVISRLKVMSKMSLDERQKPQDGRILLVEKQHVAQYYDFRVASSPTINGEEIVLRLLDNRKLTLGLEGLGIIGMPLKLIRETIKKTSGIIIVTGPTGSGKTTTLYAILQELNDPSKKIMTIEDPVEYRLQGLVQHQVREKADFKFPDAIRAFLRHDPDVILVGEIRDKETAEAAIWAAMTGHLVLTTLHTNDAASSITRLLQMGIEPYLISSTLQLILSQRLVRKLCQNCKIKKTYSAKFLKSMGFLNNKLTSDCLELELFSSPYERHISDNQIYCNKCKGKGFSDRTAIIEALKISDKIRDFIHYDLPNSELKRIAIDEGMITIKDDGLTKAFHGVTSIEEVINATLI
jgi:type IV pilus assembly protein PilB